MTHVETGLLLAYLDGEVVAGSRAEVELHLRACAACASELDGLRAASQLFSNLIKKVDEAAPTFAAYTTVSRQRQRRPFGLRSAHLARAAMFVVAAAAVVSAALPGSPVRAWIVDALREVGLLKAPAVEQQAPVAMPEERPLPVTGELGIEPADGRVRIVLSEVGDDVTLRVRLIDGARARVQTNAASDARFSTAAGRLEVTGVEAGVVTIDLPRNASQAVVQVDGRTVFRKQNSQIQLDGATTENATSEFVIKAGRR